MVWGAFFSVFLTAFFTSNSSALASDGARLVSDSEASSDCAQQMLSRQGAPEFLSSAWYDFADNHLRLRATSPAEIRQELSLLKADPQATLWQVNLLLYRLLALSPFQGGERVSTVNLLTVGHRTTAALLQEIRSFREQLLEDLLARRRSSRNQADRRVRTEISLFSPFVYGQKRGLQGETRAVDFIGLLRLAVGTTGRNSHGDLIHLVSGSHFSRSDLLALLNNAILDPENAAKPEAVVLMNRLDQILALGPAVPLLELSDYRAPRDFKKSVIIGSKADEQNPSRP